MDQFTVVDQLGAGAFGRALLCRDKSTREFVVIKEIRCADKAARDEARREAELLRKHSHPNVCRLIASFASDEQKRFYLVLEHCDGGDLSQSIAKRRTERRPYQENEAASIFVMITLALRHVHARRIVHRDVKAANVFLTKRGVAKLGDFGVSRQLDVSGGGATQPAGRDRRLTRARRGRPGWPRGQAVTRTEPEPGAPGEAAESVARSVQRCFGSRRAGELRSRLQDGRREPGFGVGVGVAGPGGPSGIGAGRPASPGPAGVARVGPVGGSGAGSAGSLPCSFPRPGDDVESAPSRPESWSVRRSKAESSGRPSASV